MTNFENKIIKDYRSIVNFPEPEYEQFLLSALALQREEVVKEIKELKETFVVIHTEARNWNHELKCYSKLEMDNKINKVLDSLTSSVPEEEDQPCATLWRRSRRKKGISHTTDAHEGKNKI